MGQRTAAHTYENAWVCEELQAINLGDKRLNKRMGKVLDRLASRPTVSIPAACCGWTETEAAYRFFDNEAVTDSSVLAPHRQATIQRSRQERVVLLANDTSELDFTSKKHKVRGLGPLNDESRMGMLTHPTVVFTPERLCLGVLDSDIWVRPELGQRNERQRKPIEDKESFHWLTSYRLACTVAEQAPDTLVVSLSDREGDIYECFAEALPEPGRRKAEWIVRAQHNRTVTVAGVEGKLWDQVAGSLVLGELVVDVPRSAKRTARQARMTVQAVPVQPRIPRRPDGKLPAVTFHAVLVREIDPPAGEEPIEWLLLTSLSASTFAEACRVVEYYTVRWMIEVYFRVLKTGCQVEERQLETTDRLRPCLALFMMVAWRILYVTWMGRSYPNLSCETLFTSQEWKSVWSVVTQRPLPTEPPTLSEFIALVASLGGHLGREHDGEPGAQTTWIGMQRMHDFARAWLTFGPGRHEKPK
jgi:hypothetical protein